jgi:hypothetical protein
MMHIKKNFNISSYFPLSRAYKNVQLLLDSLEEENIEKSFGINELRSENFTSL